MPDWDKESKEIKKKKEEDKKSIEEGREIEKTKQEIEREKERLEAIELFQFCFEDLSPYGDKTDLK